MKRDTMISLRLPFAYKHILEAAAAQRGESVSDVINWLIEVYAEDHIPEDVDPAEIDSLFEEEGSEEEGSCRTSGCGDDAVLEGLCVSCYQGVHS